MSDDENLVEKPSSTTASDKMEPTEAGTTEVKGAVKSEDVTASDSVDESVKHDAVSSGSFPIGLSFVARIETAPFLEISPVELGGLSVACSSEV